MKTTLISILGLVSLSFIVGLTLLTLISVSMIPSKHRLPKTSNDNVSMTLFKHGYIVLSVQAFINLLVVSMIVHLMHEPELRIIVKTAKLPVLYTLSLNSMTFLFLIFRMWKVIVMNLKILLLLLPTFVSQLTIIVWLFKFYMASPPNIVPFYPWWIIYNLP